MPRTDLTRNKLPGTVNPGILNPTVDAVLAADDAQFDLTGGEIVVVENETPGAINLTLVSVNDPQGRTQDETVSIAANERRVLGPFSQSGWRQADGKMYLDVDGDNLGFMLLVP